MFVMKRESESAVKVVGVIPARYGSIRLPAKALISNYSVAISKTKCLVIIYLPTSRVCLCF